MVSDHGRRFQHPLARIEPGEEPGTVLWNGFALAEELVSDALVGSDPDVEFRLITILLGFGLPLPHVRELLAEQACGNRQALLRLIEYVADSLVEEDDDEAPEAHLDAEDGVRI
jgi:hypothetical protein